MNRDKYYVDYRIGEIVKNLDTSYLAPEMWNEVIVDDALSGMYTYTYADDQDQRLTFSFTQDQLDSSELSFQEMLDSHCKKNYFNASYIVNKCMYINQEMFNEAYIEEEE